VTLEKKSHLYKKAARPFHPIRGSRQVQADLRLVVSRANKTGHITKYFWLYVLKTNYIAYCTDLPHTRKLTYFVTEN
jgi:hypothetical protein